MLTVLLTGFEPFGGAADNPSARAVLALGARRNPPAGTRVFSHVLPVRYGHAGIALHDAVRRHWPDVLIATGLAGGRADISVERVAINVDDARIPDNDGVQLIDAPVVAGGPVAYFSTLPIKAITAAIRAAGVPAQVSQTAGTFLCNHIFFRAPPRCDRGADDARRLPASALAARAGDRPSGAPSMALGDLLTALRAAIAATRDTMQDLTVAAGAVRDRRCRRAQPVEQREPAVAPFQHGVALLEKEAADATRPLQAAEHDVVGIVRRLAAEPRLALPHPAHRLQQGPPLHNPLVPPLLHRLQRHVVDFLPRLAEVRLVLRPLLLPYIRNDQAGDAGLSTVSAQAFTNSACAMPPEPPNRLGR